MGSFPNNYLGFPSICALSNDTVAIVWECFPQDGDAIGIYGTIINATTGKNITAEFQVNTYTSSSQDAPSLWILSNDKFAVV